MNPKDLTLKRLPPYTYFQPSFSTAIKTEREKERDRVGRLVGQLVSLTAASMRTSDFVA